VDFVKDFNFEYLARVEAQDRDKRLWRSEMMALDTAREARIARKDSEVVNMDQKLYELEVERTKNLGNMTSALLMMATSMDALTRYGFPPVSMLFTLAFKFVFLFAGLHFSLPDECAPSSPPGPLVPFGPPTMLSPRSRVPLGEEVGMPPPPLHAWYLSRP
jgi:hypothetical protein